MRFPWLEIFAFPFLFIGGAALLLGGLKILVAMLDAYRLRDFINPFLIVKYLRSNWEEAGFPFCAAIIGLIFLLLGLWISP